MSALGQFNNGAIQFNPDSGAIEARGTIDRPSPSATSAPAAPQTPTPSAAPDGGGVLPQRDTLNPGDAMRSSAPDTPDNTLAPGTGFDQGSGGNDVFQRARIGSSTDISKDLPWQDFGADFNRNGVIGAAAGGGNYSGFANGGEVDGPEGEDQGADSATIDPMSMFKSVLAHGRKSMGLPASFQGGPETQQEQAPSFDDGGMIPDPDEGGEGEAVTADGNTGGGLPDPRATLKYLTGDGAISPEVAHALEQHVDPDGTMPQSQRTMASIQKAPSPEAQFGMMQHYRTLFNGFSGGAHAALDRGDLGNAAANATKAFEHVPTGKDIKFAPAGGGHIAVLARDGMKQFMGAGLMGKAPVKAGEDAWEKYHGSGGTLSMDNGGEVPDDDSTEGVLAAHAAMDDEQPMVAAAEQSQGSGETTDDVLNAHAAQDDQHEQPLILKPEQFKKLLTAGYDAPVESGWDKFLSGLGVSSAEAAPATPYMAAPGGTVDRAARAAAGSPQQNPEAPASSQQQQPPAPAQSEPPAEGKKPDRYDQVLERAEKLANKLFPWASQESQRSAYVSHAMDEFQKNEESKVNVGQQSGKLAMEQIKEQGRNSRAEGSWKSKESIARQKELWSSMRDDKRQMVGMVKSAITANPQMINDPEKLANFYEQHAQRIGIHPQDLRGLVENGAAGAAAPQGGARTKPTGANMSAAKPGDMKPYTKNGVTKQYKFGTDGMWHLAQ